MRTTRWMLLAVLGCGMSGCANSPAEMAYRREMAGQAAPNFELKDLKGTSVTLAEYRGKPVLLAFWGLG